jgi:hypothetical protein
MKPSHLTIYLCLARLFVTMLTTQPAKHNPASTPPPLLYVEYNSLRRYINSIQDMARQNLPLADAGL